jgi:hypothetical protein
MFIMNKWRALFGLGLAWSLSVMAESLYVFVPTEVRASKLQQQIGSYCTNVEVTVFSRAKDFQNKLKVTPPTAILTLLPVIESSQIFNPAIIGVRAGQSQEDYLLVSVNQPINLAELENKKIGAVDLLGRKPMDNFVQQLLKSPIKLTRVTKVEDLLPLITFESVDAILISNSTFEQLKAKTNLNLFATELNIKIGLASAALTGATSTDLFKKCLFAFDKQLNSTLGVEQWRTL